MRDKQKMGTALGAYKRYRLNTRPDAPGLSPLFCGFGTHDRKNRGQFRRPLFATTERDPMKSGTLYYRHQHTNSRREQSPFFLNTNNDGTIGLEQTS